MIPMSTLVGRMSVLENRFGRALAEPVKQEYFAIFQAELTEQEYLLGTHKALRHCDFFPSPQTIIDYGKDDQSASRRAESAWDEIMLRMTGGRDTLTEPDTLERSIVAKMGGGRVISEASGYALQNLERKFKDKYVEALRTEDKSAVIPSLPRSTR